MSGHLSDKKFKEVCEEIAETCDCKGGYCFFRNLVTHQHPSLRMLIQLECIEKFKWILSEREGKDVGEQNAAMIWSTSELASAFSQAYSEEKTVRQIFKDTMEMAEQMIKEKCDCKCEDKCIGGCKKKKAA